MIRRSRISRPSAPRPICCVRSRATSWNAIIEGGAMSERIGIYPGTFDPVTLGHMDIIRRATGLVDKLVIGVTTTPSKSPMFTLDERLAMVRRETAGLGKAEIEVVAFDSLLIHFARSRGASMIVRGLRAVADFEYEYQMAGMNQQLDRK